MCSPLSTEPTATSPRVHAINEGSPAPRVPCSVTVQCLRLCLSSSGNSYLPFVYQANPYPPLSLSSNALPSGSSSRIPQADQGLLLDYTHRHTQTHTQRHPFVHKFIIAIIFSLIAYVYTQIQLSIGLRPLGTGMMSYFCIFSSWLMAP